MKRNLTCIVCPMGCSIEVELDGKNVISVTGNTCKRGEKYAESECTNPTRTITTTMRAQSGEIIPVKTDRPIPKDKIFECMKIINSSNLKLPICVGDVIIEDVFGANIVSAKNA